MKLNVPENDKGIISDIISTVKGCETAFITWHARPDGDAFGGGLALFRVLRHMNLNVDIISPTPPPGNFSFFEDFKTFIRC